MFLSIVITNYNRKHLIDKAVRSCLSELVNQDYEIIIVDDASTDSSVDFLKSQYQQLILDKKIKLVLLEKNQGVTGAKNAGFVAAVGVWVMFLDSDDFLKPQSGAEIINELKNSLKYSIVFFRCIDQTGEFVGTQFASSKVLDLDTYIEHTSFGEGLSVFQKFKTDQLAPYMTHLRGYEGLGCARHIKKYGPALLSSVVARVYDRSGDDRLSVTKGFLKRIHLVGLGHFYYFKEFYENMNIKTKVSYLLKSILFIVIGKTYNFFRRTAP